MKRAMQSGFHLKPVCRFGVLVALALAGFTGCSSSGPVAPLPPVANQVGRKAAVLVESAPSGATISVNGSVKGSAPLSIDVELDDVGEVAIELDVTADFSDSFGGARPAATATHRLARGDRVPASIVFDPEGAAVR